MSSNKKGQRSGFSSRGSNASPASNGKAAAAASAASMSSSSTTSAPTATASSAPTNAWNRPLQAKPTRPPPGLGGPAIAPAPEKAFDLRNSSNNNSISNSNNSASMQNTLRDRFLQLTLSMVGQKVVLTQTNGAVLEGIFFTFTPFSTFPAADRNTYVVKACRMIKPPSSTGASPRFRDGETVVISADKVSNILVKSMRLDNASNSNGMSHYVNASKSGDMFRTDTEISKLEGGRSGDLIAAGSAWTSPLGPSNSRAEAMMGSGFVKGNASAPALGGGLRGNIGEWDQFKANEELFNVSATFDESLYTTKLDKSLIDAEKIAKAEKIAMEIEKTTTTNMHIAEERGQTLQVDFDEEDRYSGVLKEPSNSSAANWRKEKQKIASQPDASGKTSDASKKQLSMAPKKMNYAAAVAKMDAVKPSIPATATATAPPPPKKDTPTPITTPPPPAEKKSEAATSPPPPAKTSEVIPSPSVASANEVPPPPAPEVASPSAPAISTNEAPTIAPVQVQVEPQQPPQQPLPIPKEEEGLADIPPPPAPIEQLGTTDATDPSAVMDTREAAAAPVLDESKQNQPDIEPQTDPVLEQTSETQSNAEVQEAEGTAEEYKPNDPADEVEMSKDETDDAPKKVTSKLNANAKEFTFNPSVKAFTMPAVYATSAPAPSGPEAHYVDTNTSMVGHLAPHMHGVPYMPAGPMGQPGMIPMMNPQFVRYQNPYPGMEQPMVPMLPHQPQHMQAMQPGGAEHLTVPAASPGPIDEEGTSQQQREPNHHIASNLQVQQPQHPHVPNQHMPIAYHVPPPGVPGYFGPGMPMAPRGVPQMAGYHPQMVPGPQQIPMMPAGAPYRHMYPIQPGMPPALQMRGMAGTPYYPNPGAPMHFPSHFTGNRMMDEGDRGGRGVRGATGRGRRGGRRGGRTGRSFYTGTGSGRQTPQTLPEAAEGTSSESTTPHPDGALLADQVDTTNLVAMDSSDDVHNEAGE